jgi:hypothetical protein
MVSLSWGVIAIQAPIVAVGIHLSGAKPNVIVRIAAASDGTVLTEQHSIIML